jgi:hypothetical protein
MELGLLSLRDCFEAPVLDGCAGRLRVLDRVVGLARARGFLSSPSGEESPSSMSFFGVDFDNAFL